ncbi:S-adenosyl-L-homocysteine hydrolase [Litoreibacter albidus]|uniref:S-adenosyl-L-homocysteine hydrolase n=1 Tax=Litoreibacter albidus TaxID=670155 RepID=A0A1H3BTP7_9RHOB|nr:S-adenosyl-L-homocysteine hydrolase [Litoreibacter albidus]SDX45263.1 hypothetical protein SAMN04488001_3271 [Litoreibacter albidus]
MNKLFATALILTSMAAPAQAQDSDVCMATSEMEASLLDWYGEKPAQHKEDGSIVWASGIGGTWTVVSYEPDGMSCTLAQGDNWSPDMDGDKMIASLN